MIVAAVIALAIAFTNIPQHEAPLVGTGSDNVLSTLTAASVWIGKDLDSTLIATNTGRTLLTIQNISGATGTSQTLYCAFNGVAATIYAGFVVHASSSERFMLDNLYRGALHCKFPAASSTVIVIEN